MGAEGHSNTTGGFLATQGFILESVTRTSKAARHMIWETHCETHRAVLDGSLHLRRALEARQGTLVPSMCRDSNRMKVSYFSEDDICRDKKGRGPPEGTV